MEGNTNMSYDNTNDINYYRCQFCGIESSEHNWKDDKCPNCNRKYDWVLAQDSEE